MDWPLLLLVTFFAATVQSATGFGFGLMAVSAFLVMLNSVAAIQLVIIITLVMSCFHWPTLRGGASKPLIRWLAIGCLFGFPIGIYAYSQVDITVIKAAVALLILAVTVQNAWQLFHRTERKLLAADNNNSDRATFGVGVTSGMMASCLAMPGPAVMLYLSRSSMDKDEIRATILTYFIFSYAGALLLQAILIGVETQTWITAAILSPAALAGVVAGQYASRFINQQVFTGAVLIILFSTGLFMLTSL